MNIMTKVTCPTCYHHSFEIKAVTGSSVLDVVEKMLIAVGLPTSWFKNIYMRCKTCKNYWRA